MTSRRRAGTLVLAGGLLSALLAPLLAGLPTARGSALSDVRVLPQTVPIPRATPTGAVTNPSAKASRSAAQAAPSKRASSKTSRPKKTPTSSGPASASGSAPAAVSPSRAAGGAPVVIGPIGGPYRQTVECLAHGPSMATVTDAVSAAQRELRYTELWDLSEGGGIRVAVIDTGVTAGPAFGERLVAGGDFLQTPAQGRSGLYDCDGHGTLVAGLIAGSADRRTGFAGVAPKATVISIRQNSQRFARQGPNGDLAAGSVGTLTAAIRAAIRANAKVINISAGQCAPADRLANADLVAAVQEAIRADAVVIAAAGNVDQSTGCSPQNPTNGPATTKAWPAAIPEVLSVCSVGPDGVPADFSLRGEWVDVCAPGQKLISSNPMPSANGQVSSVVGVNGTATVEGTSFSAAYVSGVVALVRARFPQLSATEVVHRVVVTADNPAEPGTSDLALGAGLIDPRRALTAMLAEEGGAHVEVNPVAQTLPAGTVDQVARQQQHHAQRIAWWTVAAVFGALAATLSATALRRSRRSQTLADSTNSTVMRRQ